MRSKPVAMGILKVSGHWVRMYGDPQPAKDEFFVLMAKAVLAAAIVVVGLYDLSLVGLL